MKVINANNVNDAVTQGILLLETCGAVIPSRNGDTLEVSEPVATVYERPWERVLISKTRDANPFFHMFEALWILAGREDVKFLTEFNKRMADYSDDGETFNAPYGFRMRYGVSATQDQIKAVIRTLKESPNSRQAVIQIWDDVDLEITTKDKACNMSVVFRIREDHLDMTVYNRSNDMLWGAYGANVVQFSTLQEYVCAHLDGVVMGTYTQVSNSYHVYLSGPGGDLWEKMKNQYYDTGFYNDTHQSWSHIYMTPIDIEAINLDIATLFNIYDTYGVDGVYNASNDTWKSMYFRYLVLPMFAAFWIHKNHGAEVALKYTDSIHASDWRRACEDWLENRLEKK